MRQLVFHLALVVVTATALFATGAREETPAVDLERVSRTHVSPDGDGIRDELVVVPRVTPAPGRAVKSFEFEVFGTTGSLAGERVRHSVIAEEHHRGFLGNLLGIGEEPEITVPDELRWDGTFLNAAPFPDGEPVPDGDYAYQITIVDDRGRSVRTPPLSVTVDRRPPVIDDVVLEHTVLSPTGDGVRDSVRILQSGSVEAAWVGQIVGPDGDTVREFSWADEAPRSVEWDGRDESGSVVADGVYRYILRGRDAAGNTSQSEPVVITLSTSDGDVRLVPSTTVISPNGDGTLDRVRYVPEVSDSQSITSWRFVVERDGRQVREVYSVESTRALPPVILFNGLSVDGELLNDGAYRAHLAVRYGNGHAATSDYLPLRIDTRPPHGSLAMETLPEPFEPGSQAVFGGRSREVVRVTASLSEERWVARITSPAGAIELPAADLGLADPEATFEWHGNDLRGRPMPDGRYTLSLQATDAAGNVGVTNEIGVVKDTRVPRVGLLLDQSVMSPNNDGVKDSLVITASRVPDDLIGESLLSIRGEDGRAVRTESMTTPSRTFEWYGRNDAGAAVPDGAYEVHLEVEYLNGNRRVATAGPVTVDNTPPEVRQLSVPHRLLSPDGDGSRDTVRIAQSTSHEDEWVGELRDADGWLVFERRWNGRATDFTWDGRDMRGAVVPDGDYTYRLTATDAAGNSGSAELALVVDTTSLPATQQAPEISLTAQPVPFTPDGDGVDDKLTFFIAAQSRNELRRWQLDITESFGDVFRSFRGEGRPPAQLGWDGRSATGELVDSGREYVAGLRVTDAYGNEAETTTRVRVGIMVMREGLRARIMIPSVTFASRSADLFAVPEPELRQNLETLRSLAEVLRRYPDREILIEGHAAHNVLEEGGARQREQEQELLPLSLARAEEVRQALMVLGIEKERMTTAGIGGARPVVPHVDRENVWKNRRVEFILRKR